jgi:hypothetical protein
MTQTILPLLKRWRPDLQWLGNEICYHYTGGSIKVDCVQLAGHGRYKAVITGVEDRAEAVESIGPSCYDAVRNALIVSGLHYDTNVDHLKDSR